MSRACCELLGTCCDHTAEVAVHSADNTTDLINMGHTNGEAAVEALCILAKGLLANGQPSQAVKCLEAVCRSSAPMPVSAASNRLWLAQVLLQHTQNIPEATQHLQKAVRAVALVATCQLRVKSQQHPVCLQQFILKQVHACQPLKCEVLSELGRCHRYLARPKLEIQQYERGIQVCINGNPSSERCAQHVCQPLDLVL